MRFKEKVLGFFTLLVITLSIVSGLFGGVATAAQEIDFNGTFLDAATIKVNSIKLTQNDYDKHLHDNVQGVSLQDLNRYLSDQTTGEYKRGDITQGDRSYKKDNGGCPSEIKYQENNWKIVNLKVNIDGRGCVFVLKDNYDPNINIASTGSNGNENIWFSWTNENTMVRVDGKDGNFVRTDQNQPNRYFRVEEADSTNQDYVQLSNDTEGVYHRRSSNGVGEVDDNTTSIHVNGVQNRTKPPTDPKINSSDGADSCESKGGPLGWIMCPVINALDGFFNWVDSRIQELLGVDETKYRSESLRATWVNIRNISYIVLIPVMLVMVISTALGFELISAYTFKRSMPRLIAAVLFIALSWELTGFLIQLSNVVGNGLLGLMTSPLSITGGEDGMTLQDLFTPSFGGAVGQAGLVAGGIGAAIVASGAGIGLLGIVFSFLGTACLFLLVAFIVLIARQLFILALVMFAPLAIIAWIFPGNDKLWKLWWSTFSKLLLMYPLITALIGSGRVFAYIVGNTPSSEAEGAVLNPLLKLVAYVLPYVLIPLTFKFAGGAIGNISGMVNDRSKGLSDRLKKGRQVRYERDGRKILQKRADLQNAWQNKAGSSSVKGRMYGFASRRIGGYNVQAADSARRAAVQKEFNDQSNAGRDDEQRGLSVNKKYALSTDGAKSLGKDANGKEIWDRDVRDKGVLWRTSSSGQRQFKTLGGAWVTEGAVDEGHRKWGHDTYYQQASLSYEMRKAATDDEVAGIGERYATLATEGDGGWGMTSGQAAGALKGAGFENQNLHLEFKHMDTDGTVDYKALAKETYERKGSYPLAQMSAHTVKQLQNAYDTGDAETQQMVQGIAETFMTRYGGAGGVGDDPAQAAIAEQQRQALIASGVSPARAEQVVQTNAPGSAHVAEAVRKLAVHTGVYHPLPPSGDVGPIAPAPPTNLQH